MTTEHDFQDSLSGQATEPQPVETLKRNRGGAPRGNQNARKHGFYATSLTPEEKEALRQALELKDLTPEIALLRVKILELAPHSDTSPELLIKALRTITRMVAVQDKVKYG